MEGDRHLWNCLRYIDLNMVRAGAVKHPRDWAWCGYHELAGLRTRYRLIDRARLLEAWGDGRDPDALAGSYADAIDEACRRSGALRREPEWTESLAVGSEHFVRSVEATLKNRRRTQIEETDAASNTWVLRERPPEYS